VVCFVGLIGGGRASVLAPAGLVDAELAQASQRQISVQNCYSKDLAKKAISA
jgi:hypothetical protein